jgi:hypothetical protein
MNKKEYAYKAVFWSLFIGWGIIVVLIGIGLFDKEGRPYCGGSGNGWEIGERAVDRGGENRYVLCG